MDRPEVFVEMRETLVARYAVQRKGLHRSLGVIATKVNDNKLTLPLDLIDCTLLHMNYYSPLLAG